MANTTKVTIIPSTTISWATSARAHLSAAVAYMRIGDAEKMNAEFWSLRKAVDKLDDEANRIVGKDE